MLLVCGAVLAVTLGHGGSSQSAFRSFPSAIQIGQNSRHSKYSRQQQEGKVDLEGKTKLSIGIVLPHSTFRRRRYDSAITTAIMNMKRHSELQEVMQKYHFTSREVIMSTMYASSSPTSKCHLLASFFVSKISEARLPRHGMRTAWAESRSGRGPLAHVLRRTRPCSCNLWRYCIYERGRGT